MDRKVATISVAKCFKRRSYGDVTQHLNLLPAVTIICDLGVTVLPSVHIIAIGAEAHQRANAFLGNFSTGDLNLERAFVTYVLQLYNTVPLRGRLL